jgi:hypothetical protein
LVGGIPRLHTLNLHQFSPFWAATNACISAELAVALSTKNLKALRNFKSYESLALLSREFFKKC